MPAGLLIAIGKCLLGGFAGRLDFDVSFQLRQEEVRQIARAVEVEALDLVLPVDAGSVEEHRVACFGAGPEAKPAIFRFR